MTSIDLASARPDGGRGIGLAETGWLPDALIRAGIRRLNRERLAEIGAGDCAVEARQVDELVRRMNSSEIAPRPDLANAQHYEVPAEFFGYALGAHRKYSACLWEPGISTLDDAEARALEVTCARAGIADGMRVLELGCGWGSLTLWMAQRFPGCRITAVSNSQSQRSYIEAAARSRGLGNVEVLTRDMNEFDISPGFDRIVSVEMFEHMRNYRELFRRISLWLAPEGRFFMHIFCHRGTAYEFVDNGPEDWMSRYFFAGGLMPSVDLPLRFQEHLSLARHWRWDGRQYQRTAEAWLENMDRNRPAIMALFASVYGQDAARWFQRWRIFFMACAELFGHGRGQEWLVGHYLFARGSHG
jgi:cyclopropane-fatty-acyl-phospholipid synthase